MKVIELNKPAVGASIRSKEISIKPYVSHMMYIDKNKIIQQASLEVPAYRLAKDYTVDDVTYSLNLLITDNNVKKAEKFMDNVAKDLTKQEVYDILHNNQPFTYINKLYEVKK